jgi:hypothetical protein
VVLRGGNDGGFEIALEGVSSGYQRFSITQKKSEVIVKRGDKETQRLTLPKDFSRRGWFGLKDTGHATEFMNLYARDL